MWQSKWLELTITYHLDKANLGLMHLVGSLLAV